MSKPNQSEVADIETRLQKTDHSALRSWLRLLACTNLIESRVRQQLSREFNITLPRFDFMAQLDRVPDGLTMSQLSERMMVTGGNVTGIAKALQAEGLIVRRSDSQDRRVFRVALSTEGRRFFNQMAKAHEQWIVEMFSGLSSKKQSELNDLLGELKTLAQNQDKRGTG